MPDIVSDIVTFLLSNQPVIGQVQALPLFMLIHNNSLRNVKMRNL